MQHPIPVHPGFRGVVRDIEDNPTVNVGYQSEVSKVREEVWLHDA
jgi:hypothetical protein